MKFKELDSEQKTAFTQFFCNIQNIKTQEEQNIVNQFYRLLIVGNGAGILLLSTFMGALTANGRPIAQLLSPLLKFLIGAALATFILFFAMGIASQAVVHMERQIKEIFHNVLDVENYQGYGFSKGGMRILRAIILGSLTMFIWGVVQCVLILKNY